MHGLGIAFRFLGPLVWPAQICSGSLHLGVSEPEQTSAFIPVPPAQKVWAMKLGQFSSFVQLLFINRTAPIIGRVGATTVNIVPVVVENSTDLRQVVATASNTGRSVSTGENTVTNV